MDVLILAKGYEKNLFRVLFPTMSPISSISCQGENCQTRLFFVDDGKKWLLAATWATAICPKCFFYLEVGL